MKARTIPTPPPSHHPMALVFSLLMARVLGDEHCCESEIAICRPFWPEAEPKPKRKKKARPKKADVRAKQREWNRSNFPWRDEVMAPMDIAEELGRIR